jgi:hypothetical protein
MFYSGIGFNLKLKQCNVANFSYFWVCYTKINGSERRFSFELSSVCQDHILLQCWTMHKKFKVEENQLGTFCCDVVVDSFW